MPKITSLLLISSAILATGCGPISHQLSEGMEADDRFNWLSSLSNEKLCSGYNNSFLKPNTEIQIIEILRSRNIEKCESLGKVRYVTAPLPKPTTPPLKDFKKPDPFKEPASPLITGLTGSLPKQETVSRETRSTPKIEISVTYDEFKKEWSFKGPNLAQGGNYLFLRATRKEGREPKVQIYVADSYYSNGNWREYHSSWDSDGEKLDFSNIHRDIGLCLNSSGCFLTEHGVINVAKKYLETKREAGVKFKVFGAEDNVFEIPPNYISAFLDAFDNKPSE